MTSPLSRRDVLVASAATVASAVLLAPAAGAAPRRLTVLDAARSHLGATSSLVLTDRQIKDDLGWCSEFACLCYTEARAAKLFTLGVRGSAVNHTTDDWWAWARDHGRMRWQNQALYDSATAPNALLTSSVQPQPSDIVLEWHWKEKLQRWSTHTAIVESVAIEDVTITDTSDPTHPVTTTERRRVYYTVDGNWSDTVLRRRVATDTQGKIFAVIRPS